MKKYYYLLLLFFSVFANAQYTVDFEVETKGSYASGDLALNGFQWNMTEALIGNSTSDWKNGTKSARLRGYATSSISMLEDKTNGLGTLSFSYNRYGSDDQVAWKVEYSTDSGDSWVQLGESFTALAESTVQTFSEALNVEGNIRIRILADIETGTSNRRLNVDDITLTDFPSAGPVATINTSTNSIGSLNYVLNEGPSDSQSFDVSISDLDPVTGNLTVTAPANFEVSLDDSIFSDDLQLAYVDNVLTSVTVYVRLKSGLVSGNYMESLVIAGGGASDKIVALDGNVAQPFGVPYENNFRTQENVDAAIISGFTFDGDVVYGGTGGGGYTRMPNLSSIISPSIEFSGEDFINVSFALATFGGTTGQKLALKYSTNDGVDYETINTFDVGSSYKTFNQIIYLNGFEGVGKLKFEMVEGSNQIRFRDLTLAYLDEITPTVSSDFCGTTIESAIYDYVTLAQGYDADMYEFTLSNAVTDVVVEKSVPNVRFGDFGVANFNYGNTYNLSVRVKYGEVYSNVSDVCEITLTSNPLSSVQSLCGQTVTSIHTKVYVFAVSKASSYRYSVKNLLTDNEQFYVSNKRFFTFASLENFDFNTAYEVKVQVKIGNGEYGDFGTVCSVNSPESVFSKLRDAYCGVTLSNLFENVYADVVVGASGYKFKITENGNSQEIETTDSRFSFAFADNVLLNQAYDVEVAVLFNGSYGDYSDVCVVTTPTDLPTTSLRSQYCNITLPSLGSNFYARIVYGATAYRFKTTINGEEVVVERNDSRCFMSAFSGSMMNETYSIEVAAFLNGVWTPYGSACTILIGASVDFKIANQTAAIEVIAFPNPSVNSFTISFNQEIENGSVQVYDLTGKQVQTVQINKTHAIDFGSDLQSGIYFATIQSGNFTETIRLIKK
uniref:T9SS type A sorting domain-containing protein n=1 Tax=Flavobacterium sp. TaxID=239 RepID=UPI00404A20C4